jgi:hypothetical protein
MILSATKQTEPKAPVSVRLTDQALFLIDKPPTLTPPPLPQGFHQFSHATRPHPGVRGVEHLFYLQFTMHPGEARLLAERTPSFIGEVPFWVFGYGECA